MGANSLDEIDTENNRKLRDDVKSKIDDLSKTIDKFPGLKNIYDLLVKEIYLLIEEDVILESLTSDTLKLESELNSYVEKLQEDVGVIQLGIDSLVGKFSFAEKRSERSVKRMLGKHTDSDTLESGVVIPLIEKLLSDGKRIIKETRIQLASAIGG